VLEACRVIRAHLGALLDTHLAVGLGFDDIAQQVIEARDDLGGKALTREELIDQLGELFLAGDETSARALTRCFAILASHPALVARLRAEVEEVTGGGPIEFHHLKRLTLTRNIFRETLRLYPPITFLPRIANQATSLDGYRLKKGALVMVAPWVLHRHRLYWQEARVLPARGVTCRWQGKTFCHSVGSRHVGRPVRSDDPGRSA
jgi:cytochrome P450